MKIGIVGCGMVGATAAYALVMRGIGGEIVLVDRNPQRAQAEADDILHAVPFARPARVQVGSYADLAESRVVILSAGVGQKPGETRLQLLQRNSAIFAEVVPQVLQHAPHAVLLVATNPVDVMTHLTTQLATAHGVPPQRVLGSGTTLDTARYRALLGKHCKVDSHHVHAYVVGEHGDSEVLTWSLVTVGSMPLADFARWRGIQLGEEVRQEIDQQVRGAADRIIRGKGATYYGIGSALTRIIEAIVQDQRAILTVSALRQEVSGVLQVTLSVPSLVGGEGVHAALPLLLNETEQQQLQQSARVVRQAIDELQSSPETKA